MNAATIPFRLIIINDSQEEAHRLTSMLQNAGRPCRAQHVNTEEAFKKTIEEQVWDLAIAHNDTQSLPPAEVIRTIREYNQDLPLILLSDDEGERTVIDGMRLGACDVVKLDDDQHLLLVISRELDNRQYRKKTRIIEREIKAMEYRNRQLLDSSKNGIAFIQDGMYIYTNDSFAEMCGYKSHNEIECLPIMDMVDPDDQEHVKQVLKNFALQNDKNQENHLSFQVKSATGELKKIEAELELSHFDEESCIQLLSQANTLVDNVFLEAELETIRHTDETTGLYNKTHVLEVLRKRVADAASNETAHAVFYIDIDQFKENVNSAVGLDGADTVLATIAGFLQANCHADDLLARFSDHSFVITSHENNPEALLNSGNTLCKLIREHFFEVNNKTLRLTASIGISIINETTIDAQSAINQASQAVETLRKQHQNGVGDGVNIFNPQESEHTVLVGPLQKALKDGSFKLLFQPVISLRGDDTERYEVLLRMLDENQQEISPNNFLKTADSVQLSSKIDRWVILESIKHLSQHSKNAENTQLIINLTNQTLCDDAIVPWLKVALQAAKINPASLVLQAQETSITQHLTAAKKFIGEAKAIGVSFCISHFGCEIEPMSLLQHIDIDRIKIDSSFSLEMQDNPDNIEAAEHLISALQDHSKTITVPMVENASILSKLWKMGVHYIQGNYLQPPGAAMDYEFNADN